MARTLVLRSALRVFQSLTPAGPSVPGWDLRIPFRGPSHCMWTALLYKIRFHTVSLHPWERPNLGSACFKCVSPTPSHFHCFLFAAALPSRTVSSRLFDCPLAPRVVVSLDLPPRTIPGGKCCDRVNSAKSRASFGGLIFYGTETKYKESSGRASHRRSWVLSPGRR
ncbi:hypothetical protein CALCODRAFT_505180 [Calocera cornea HHB12733]|uniref:Uncharacterized protein n=1 Tax=Calocera cornea HHB12733 TaxID=1353952 RepID=A0A166LC06_9BASI|nr:hypothetical protein CALCODRAFT_505180 [Calocera cornea HHB12733]